LSKTAVRIRRNSAFPEKEISQEIKMLGLHQGGRGTTLASDQWLSPS
jgi:hypothetical protein